ncbi:MAG: MFS transporter [Dehalococcoidia bacterium]
MASESLRTPGVSEILPLDESETPPAASARPGMFDSLQDGSYRWFFLSMASWFAAMNMSQLVNGFIVFDLTGSYAALGLVSLATAIPMLFLSLPGGVIADRFPKQRVIQMGQIVNTLVASILAVLTLLGALEFVHLMISGAIQGAVFGLIIPSRQTMIADVVSESRLMNGVALNTAGQNVMRLAAPPVGGLLLTVVGAGWVFVSMAVLYGIAAFCMLPVRPRPDALTVTRRARPGERNLGFKDILDGCRYIWHDKTILLILATSCVIVMLSMPIQQMLPGFVKEVLGASGLGLGIIMSVIGLGSVIGSLLVANMGGNNRGAWLMAAAVISGASLLGFALSDMLWLSSIMAVILGIGQALRISISSVLVQTYTEPEYRGRVMSVYMMQFSFVSFGTFFVGVLAGEIGVQVALALTGAALLIFSVVTMVLFPTMRKLA